MRDWEFTNYQHKLEHKLYIHHYNMIYVFLQFKMTVKVYIALIFQRDAVILCPRLSTIQMYCSKMLT